MDDDDARTLDLSTRTRVKVLVVSDTHSLVDPRVIARTKGKDLVVHGGDVGSASVLEALAGEGTQVVAVLGNNDVVEKWPAGDGERLSSLPRVWRVALPGGALVVEHGHEAGPLQGRHARLRKRYPDARAVVVGHSHLLVVDDEASPWVLNPGAAGWERTHGGPSFVELVATRSAWRASPTRLPPTPRPRSARRSRGKTTTQPRSKRER